MKLSALISAGVWLLAQMPLALSVPTSQAREIVERDLPKAVYAHFMV